MAGSANERRERLIVEAFLTLLPESAALSARLVQMRDKPDAEIELESGQRVGVEVTELFDSDDGRDRHLESTAAQDIEAACRDVLGLHGEVDMRPTGRPRDLGQVRRWLHAFRGWLRCNAKVIREEGGVYYRPFPPSAAMPRALATERGHDGTDATRRAEDAEDLAWLGIESIEITPSGGWHIFGLPGGDHLALRHRDILDEMLVECVQQKCRKAAGCEFDGPLWCVVRNPFLAEPSTDLDRCVAQLDGIDRFDQVWVVNLVVNVIDAARPPTCRRLR